MLYSNVVMGIRKTHHKYSTNLYIDHDYKKLVYIHALFEEKRREFLRISILKNENGNKIFFHSSTHRDIEKHKMKNAET